VVVVLASFCRTGRWHGRTMQALASLLLSITGYNAAMVLILLFPAVF